VVEQSFQKDWQFMRDCSILRYGVYYLENRCAIAIRFNPIVINHDGSLRFVHPNSVIANQISGCWASALKLQGQPVIVAVQIRLIFLPQIAWMREARCRHFRVSNAHFPAFC
jgi:hypothetical protein